AGVEPGATGSAGIAVEPEAVAESSAPNAEAVIDAAPLAADGQDAELTDPAASPSLLQAAYQRVAGLLPVDVPGADNMAEPGAVPPGSAVAERTEPEEPVAVVDTSAASPGAEVPEPGTALTAEAASAGSEVNVAAREPSAAAVDAPVLTRERPATDLYTELRRPEPVAEVSVVRNDPMAPVNDVPQAASSADRELPAPDPRLVAELLERAARQRAREQLTLPRGNNAVDTYREVLRVDPGNAVATRGIEEIKALYGEWAGFAAKRGEWDAVARYHQRALRIDPDDPRLQANLERARNRGGGATGKAQNARVAVVKGRSKPITPTVLADSAMSGDFDTAKLLLEAGLEADADVDAYGYTALMFAAMNGHLKVVELLLDRGADINGQSDDGRTALMVAAWNGHEKVVLNLIDRGADVNVRNEEGWTALTHAAWKGHKTIAGTLLAHGADPKVKNRDGWTALDSARERGHSTIVKLIKQYAP
ncbi:MAG: ankyrin repeat domain-containing protein, partial [Gammaproteobacteria bacterium]|nr:ankyrin repeat domain-containing protein [Gammaproteobacteria bacterium]